MMIWLKFGANPALFWLIATLLVVWGVFFNAVTAYSERKRWTEGYLSLYVMVGVIGTLVGVAIIDLGSALLCAAGFICTGTPMIVLYAIFPVGLDGEIILPGQVQSGPL